MGWLELDGKVAIVTGGAAGIGGACSEGLAEAGARVVDGEAGHVGELSLQFRGDLVAPRDA